MERTMKHLFILNPIAGGNSVDHGKVQENINKLTATLDGETECYVTSAPMDAAEKVKREAIKGGELRVYACGGDGTLSECVHGASGYRNASVTHYPCGTGNDFIRIFGEQATLFSDLDALTHGTVVPMDIIDANGRKCINICSVGIDARVGTDVHKYSKLPLIGGAGGYVVALIVNFIKGMTSEMTITTENGTYSGQYTLVCACNGRFY
jgi:diacylglycerol kinase family enzyme